MPAALLNDAIKQVEENLTHGVKCPCCKQFAKEYKRKLTSTMAQGLIWLVAQYVVSHDWIHFNNNAPRNLIKGGDFAKLIHWNLIISKPNTDVKKHSSGFYMPTVEGMEFARSLCNVPAYIYVYNGKLQGFDKEQTSIVDALGKHFDYQELIEEHPLYSYHHEDCLPSHLRRQAS